MSRRQNVTGCIVLPCLALLYSQGCPDVIVRLICPSTQFFTVSTLALVSYPSSVVMKCVINEWQLVDPPGAIFTPGLLAGCATGKEK